jgi:hypothetical protein
MGYQQSDQIAPMLSQSVAKSFDQRSSMNYRKHYDSTRETLSLGVTWLSLELLLLFT